MNSDLRSIFLQPPRQAEHAETRAEIRRHESDRQKREGKEKPDQPESFFDTDDTATLSVPALAAFLDNFLDTLTNDANPDDIKTVAQNLADPHSKSAHAASAYARTERGVKTDAVLTPATSNPVLSESEIWLMRQIRDNVQTLIARNIEILKIEKGESFLASLAASVEKALNI